jgi:protein-S-isoprenylcysteine O-methyltransferase Ste14
LLRFVSSLATENARLGASADRYSFTAVDLHHLLLAGLPAHCHRNSVIPVEERMLAEMFGEAWTAYRDRTRRWI